MVEVFGDFWAIKEILNPGGIVFTSNRIVTNDGRLVMGGGIARDFRDRYPTLDKTLGNVLKACPSAHLMAVKLKAESSIVFAFPTKEHWKNPSIIEYIEKSCAELVNEVDDMQLKTVLMTRPGCGLGGLDWEGQVKEICQKYFDDRFYVCQK